MAPGKMKTLKTDKNRENQNVEVDERDQDENKKRNDSTI